MLLIILFVLCILFLIPIQVKFWFRDGKWQVTAQYLWFKFLKKESAPEPPPPELPPKPDPPADSPAAAYDAGSTPETVTQTAADSEEEKPEPSEAKPEPAAEELPKPEKKKKPKKEKPKKEKKEKRKKKKPAISEGHSETDTDEQQEEEKPKKRGFIKRIIKPQGLREILDRVEDGCAALSPSLSFLTKHFHFRHVKLYLAVGSDDPSNTAQLYGKICAGAFNLLGQLQCRFDIETDEFRILADFYGDSIVFRTSLELRVSPAALILTVLILGIKFLWLCIKRFRREDKEAKRIAAETAPVPAS